MTAPEPVPHADLFGGRALELAPRVLWGSAGGVGLPFVLARLEFHPRGLDAHERALATRAGARFAPRSGGYEAVALDAAALGDLAEHGASLALLAHAARAAAAALPPPVLVGVLNTTPDSFSDGGRHTSVDAAADAATKLAQAGAAWVDVGGESTRPGATPVAADEEARRVWPVIEALGPRFAAGICIDTMKATVAAGALDRGASWVNDVSAGCADPGMLPLVADRGAGICLMHKRGVPATMQKDPVYTDVVREVVEHLRGRVGAAHAAGIALPRIWIDPGIGFGKTLEHNLVLIARLHEFCSLGLPILLGVSRKGFVGTLTGQREAAARLMGTAAAVALGIQGGATLLRVHDVAAMGEVLAVARAVRDAKGPQ